MFTLKSSVSVRRIENGNGHDNGNGDAAIYKVSSSGLQVKVCVPKTKTQTHEKPLFNGSMSGYPELPFASAPPEPWYYSLYPIEVITKAESLLEKTWRYLPEEHQKFFLQFYLNLSIHNLLE
jgi:hypothetical protein